MKKILYIAAAVLMLAGCSEDREHILKVYNWADYIDEELLDEFEVWYEEQTGEPVEIIYQTFDINETMLSKIELGHEDYDVVCPSDYIIERMLMNDLLLPLDRDFGDTPDYIGNVAPYITEKFNQIEGHGKNANDYSVGYIQGCIYITAYSTQQRGPGRRRKGHPHTSFRHIGGIHQNGGGISEFIQGVRMRLGG